MLIQYEQPRPQVALIRLNRPEKMNAFSIPLERDLLSGIRRACDDEDVRVVIFAGAGRAFWRLAQRTVDHGLERGRLELNDTRARLGLPPLAHVHGGISRSAPSSQPMYQSGWAAVLTAGALKGP